MGSTRSLIEYESGSTTLLGGLAWKPTDKLAVDGSLVWNRADAGLDRVDLVVPAAYLAANPNQAFDFSEMHAASDLDLSRFEGRVAVSYAIGAKASLIGEYRYADLEDDAPYLEDLSGTLSSWSAALRWQF